MNKKIAEWPESREMTELEGGHQRLSLRALLNIAERYHIPESEYDHLHLRPDKEYIDYDDFVGLIDIDYDRPLTVIEKEERVRIHNKSIEARRVTRSKKAKLAKFLNALTPEQRVSWEAIDQ